MKLIVFAIILHQVASLNLKQSRIVNGEVASPGQLPYQALLITIKKNGNRGWSAGVLIHESWVLTAAHCLIHPISYEVHLGSSAFSGNESNRVIIPSELAIMHEGYLGNQPNNDIGLVKLSIPVKFTDFIQPVKLPPANAGNFVNEVGIVSGWGRWGKFGNLGYGILGRPDQLRLVRLTVLSAERCTNYYRQYYNKDLAICAYDYDAIKSGACYGDSGGPLVHRDSNVLIGIFGYLPWKGCAAGPSGFARVSAYLPWIAKNAGI